MKHLISYNESVKDFLKPKSEDDINKSLKNLSPYKKFKKGCEYGLLPIVIQSLIENDEDDPDFIQTGIRIALQNNHTHIYKLLQEVKKNYGQLLTFLNNNK